MLTNRNTSLIARTVFGGRTLDFDFPSFLVGVAEFDEGPFQTLMDGDTLCRDDKRGREPDDGGRHARNADWGARLGRDLDYSRIKSVPGLANPLRPAALRGSSAAAGVPAIGPGGCRIRGEERWQN